MITAAILSFLFAPAPQAPGPWESSPARLTEVKEFLIARAEAWEAAFPTVIRWSEWDETSAGAVAWSGVYHGSKMAADYTVYPEGVDREAAGKGAAGHRASLVCDGHRWLVVERPIPDEPGRAWSGVESASCPTYHWSTTMLGGMLYPLYRDSMQRYVTQHELVRVRELADGIEVEFAATANVAKYIAEGKLDWMRGMLGITVTFTRDCGWRPTVIREIHTPDSVLARPGSEDIERTEFGGIDARVLRCYRWTGWTRLGAIMVPTAFASDLAVRTEVEGLIPLRSVTRSTFAATVLAQLPAGQSFALVPPAWVGQVGRISNTETGVVQVFDARGPAERIDSRASFVSMLTSNADRSELRPAEGVRRSWTALVLVAVGAALLGWVSTHWLRRRLV